MQSVYGQWTVVGPIVNHSRKQRVLCRCKCGTERNVRLDSLKSGRTTNCGCVSAKLAKVPVPGEVFGYYTVIEPIGMDAHNNLLVRAACKCGEVRSVRACRLRAGETQSCGCIRLDTEPKPKKHFERGESGLAALFSNTKWRAKERGHEFLLTKEEFQRLSVMDCFYCGEAPSMIAKPAGNTRDHLRDFGQFVYNGLDRFDNERGYTIDNAVPCCRFCNIAKNNHSLEYFLEKVEQILLRFPRVKVAK